MINDILKIVNAWDPIKIKNYTPENEYLSECQQIQDFILSKNKIKEKELSMFIKKVFTTSFDFEVFSVNDHDIDNIARKILETFHK